MKRTLRRFLLVLAVMLSFCFNSIAAETETDTDADTGAQLYYVTDAAYLLSSEEDYALEIMAETVSQQYGVGVYVVTVDDYLDFNTEGVYEATYTIYHDYSMGEGENRDGIMLLLSMADRDYALFCYGEEAEYAFSDAAQQQVEELFLDNFAEDDWYGGFEDYVAACAGCLELAANGQPIRASRTIPILVVIGVSLLIAGIVLVVLWAKMKSVAKKTTAEPYISGALQLTEKSDVFSHRTESRRKIERSSSSGSSSESGGGGSGRSGKF